MKPVPCPVCHMIPHWTGSSNGDGYLSCPHFGAKAALFDAVSQASLGSIRSQAQHWNDAFGERVAPQTDPPAEGVRGITISPETMDLASDMARCATDLRLALLKSRELDSGPTEQYARWCEQQARDLFAILRVDPK